MKSLFCLLLSILALCSEPEHSDSLTVMFWNLENFFDYFDSSEGASDTEFSPRGDRHWTKKKFRAKCQAVAKSIFWIADQNGGFPSVIGFAEVENRFVLKSLLETTLLSKLGYRIVHYDSSDHRGIDVALLYDTSRLEYVSSTPLKIYDENSEIIPTRDMLLVRLKGKQDYDFIVLHHPSKYGGKGSSTRERAIERLGSVWDSLSVSGSSAIVAFGDFNDVPSNEALSSMTEPRNIRNLALPLEGRRGTIRFNGKWELIDMFLVSESVKTPGMEIISIPFLSARDNVHAGEKPLRTYSGPRYLGGVSDHRPILLHLTME